MLTQPVHSRCVQLTDSVAARDFRCCMLTDVAYHHMNYMHCFALSYNQLYDAR
jgi:hypothetical protein